MHLKGFRGNTLLHDTISQMGKVGLNGSETQHQPKLRIASYNNGNILAV